MGNAEALPAGGVQFMSAGTGVVHSEMNNGAATCRFLQVWLTPDARGHEPQYGSLQTTPDQRRNRLLAILRGTGEPPAWHSATQHPAAPRLHQDAAVFVSQAEPGVSQEAVLEPGRQAYVVCIEGSLRVGGPEGEESLAAREAAELVAGARPLHVDLAAGEEGAHFMVIEMTQRPRRA
jgi:redox-sensitive bicupin YhaK (pirin superfamily)